MHTVEYEFQNLFLLKNIIEIGNNNFVFKANVNVLHQNLLVLMDKIDINENILVDTTFIKGDKSDYINEIDRDLIKDKFPKFCLLDKIFDTGTKIFSFIFIQN